jgi:Restriction endonuclease
MIDWSEIPDGDTWEFFARDFFTALGFVIEIGPSRGADAGKDLIISEQLQGNLYTQKFTWLVSCKHYSTSKKSVGPSDEQNITDRLKQHKADGFIGFYSTMASSSLNDRLVSYEQDKAVSAFEIFDGRKIEGYFVQSGFSKLAYRYIPKNYAAMRPLQNYVNVELICKICDKDLLKDSVLNPYGGIVVHVTEKSENRVTVSVCTVCKGECDRKLGKRADAEGHDAIFWEDIGDLCNPVFFMKNMLSYMNVIYKDNTKYTEEAHDQMKHVYLGLSKRTLREMTDEDMNRFGDLCSIESMFT